MRRSFVTLAELRSLRTLFQERGPKRHYYNFDKILWKNPPFEDYQQIFQNLIDSFGSILLFSIFPHFLQIFAKLMEVNIVVHHYLESVIRYLECYNLKHLLLLLIFVVVVVHLHWKGDFCRILDKLWNFIFLRELWVGTVFQFGL